MTTATRSKPFVHPHALCETDRVGEGTRIWAFAHAMSGATIGRDCNIGGHAFIETGARVGDRVTIKNQVLIWDGVSIEDDVFVGPGVVFTNDRYPRSPRMADAPPQYRDKDRWLEPTTVRQGATIGAAAVILCGVTIGRYATVAAASLVTRDVPPHCLVAGSPAAQRGWVCICGMRLNDAYACTRCHREFELQNEQLVVLE